LHIEGDAAVLFGAACKPPRSTSRAPPKDLLKLKKAAPAWLRIQRRPRWPIACGVQAPNRLLDHVNDGDEFAGLLDRIVRQHVDARFVIFDGTPNAQAENVINSATRY
jgi:hypothetical protein